MNLAEFIIEGSVGGVSPPADRGYDGEHGETLALRITAPAAAAVQRVSFRVYSPDSPDSPRCSKDAPVLDLEGATTGQAVDAATPTTDVEVELPGSGVHAWIIRCLVNGGKNAQSKDDPDYVFERMVVIRSESGARKIISVESTQYQPEGWAEAFNDLVENGGGGGGGDAAAVTYDPTDSGLDATDVQAAIDELAVASGSGGLTCSAGQIPVGSGTNEATGSDSFTAVVNDGVGLAAVDLGGEGFSTAAFQARGATAAFACYDDGAGAGTLRGALSASTTEVKLAAVALPLELEGTEIRCSSKEVKNVGAPTSPTSAARLVDIATLAPNEQTGTSYTLQLSDVGRCVVADNATEFELTIPDSGDVGFPVGCIVYIYQANDGQVEVVADGDAELDPNDTFAAKALGRGSMMMLWHRATDVWVLTGEREAV